VGDQLRAAYSSQPLRQYYLQKHTHWNSSTIDDIDWFLSGKALKLLPINTRRTIQKFIHRWLPTNAHPSLGNSGTSQLCPYCQDSPEPIPHFLTSTLPQATQARLTMTTTVGNKLKQSRTSPVFQSLILSALGPWCTTIAPPSPTTLPPEYHTLFDRQSTINGSASTTLHTQTPN
jgi:hypothetical protein